MLTLRKKVLALVVGMSMAVVPSAALTAAGAAPFERFTIEDIEVRGLNRVSLGAVLLALPVTTGDVLTYEDSQLALRRLYSTGNFDDVSLSRDGNRMIVTVKERPIIGSVTFTGNSQIDEEPLREVIEQQGMRTGEPLNVQTLNEIQKSLEDFYHSAGMYQARVRTVLTYLPRNRVDIKLEFTEGVSAEIQQINIVGNKSFDEDLLLSQLQLRDDVPWWNFMANQRYDTQKFGADLEALRSYYMDRGFVKFRLESTSVEMTPDKRGLYLTIVIDEGDQYTYGDCSIRGDTLKYGDMMQELITLERGGVYSAREVAAVEAALKNFLGKFGYAYSEVHAFPIYDEENKVVNLEFNVIPGSRIYVSQVLVSGNTQTDDTVVRREIRQMDGTWLSTEAVDVSRARLNRTGFYETVDMNVQRIGMGGDTVNLNAVIKEQPTGSINGGIGYGTDSGIMIQGGISQNNVFGWGTRVSLTAYDNDYRRHAEIGYTDPYFTVDGISLGGRVYYDKFDADDADLVSYDSTSIGAEATLGYPLSETLFVSYSLGYEYNDVDNTNDNFLQAKVFWDQYGDGDLSGQFNNFTSAFRLTRNNLDRTVFPTDGSRQVLSLFATVPGSDLQYYKTSVETSHYFPVDSNHDFVLAFRGRAAFGDGYGTKNGKAQRLPFFTNFYLGGSEWLRGFKSNTVGPKAIYPLSSGGYYESDTSVGGNALWAASFEIIVPTPFITETYKRQVRTALFLDAGALWDTRDDDYAEAVGRSSADEYRASVGIAFTWMSPIGPLAFSLAKAIKDYSGDETREFNFNIGGTF